MVVANGLVLDVDIVAHPPAEYAEIAAVLAEGIARAEDTTGRSPEIVETRHREVAVPLQSLLAPRGIRVVDESSLKELDDALSALEANVLTADAEPNGLGPSPSAAHRWAGWGWPSDLVGEFFRAAAAFYCAAPWRTIGDDEILTVATAAGRAWHTSVLGNAEETFGLALYGNKLDLEDLLSGDELAFAQLSRSRGPVLSLTFNRFDELPRGMHREIRGAKWEVAGPTAYPFLMAINTPGGGITLEQAGDLITVLGACERFIGAHESMLNDAARAGVVIKVPEWTDASTGAAVQYDGSWTEIPPLWTRPERLATSGAEGRGARPGVYLVLGDAREAQVADEQARLGRYRIWLARRGNRPPKPDAIARDVAVAFGLVMTVIEGGGLIPGLNEVDLRVFLYANYPLRARRNASHTRALASLGTFFEFLAESEGVVCPWAAAILADVDALTVRCEGAPRGDSTEAEREGFFMELSSDLHARVLQPIVSDGVGDAWSMPGAHAVNLMLSREWLRWRDEVIRGGETDPEAVVDALLVRRRVWDVTPHPALSGLTPLDWVRANTALVDDL